MNARDASDVWRNAGKYKGGKPAARANDKHSFNVTGKPCLSCHDGTNTAPPFAYGGTVAQGEDWEWASDSWLPGPPSLGWGGYGQGSPSGIYGSDGWQSGHKGWPKDRSKPAAGVEIRVIGYDGLVFQTVSDEDGNFWYKTLTELKQPALTGIRKKDFTKALRSNGPDCAKCHESGDEPGRIWVWDGKEPTWSPFPLPF